MLASSSADGGYIHLPVFNYSLFISPELVLIVCSRNLIQAAGVNESFNNRCPPRPEILFFSK